MPRDFTEEQRATIQRDYDTGALTPENRLLAEKLPWLVRRPAQAPAPGTPPAVPAASPAPAPVSTAGPTKTAPTWPDTPGAQAKLSAFGKPVSAFGAPVKEILPQGVPADRATPSRTWDQSSKRLLAELGLPLALAIMTRNPAAMQNVWQRATQLGLTSALGTFLASLGAESFDPSARPVPEAGRKALEAGGAALGGGVLTPLAPGAARLARTGVGALRAVGAGTGAAAGSLAAEPFDPSASPAQRAGIVGGSVAGLQAAGAPLGRLRTGATGKALTPLGREAAETMRAEGVAIPASVSESKILQAAEHEGERSLIGGRYLEHAWRDARQRLTSAADSIMRQLRNGRTPAQIEQTTSAMYRGLDDLADHAMARPTRPVAMTGIAERAQAELPLFGRGGGSPVFDRLRSFVSLVSQAPDTLPYADAVRYARQGQLLLTEAERAGVPAHTRGQLQGLVSMLRAAHTSDKLVDMRGLQPVFDDLRALAARFLPDSAEGNLLRRVAQTDPFVTPEAARALRSDLLEIGRTIPDEGVRLGRFRGSLRHVASELERDVDQNIERAYTGLGPDVAQAWRGANTARKTQAQVARLGTLVEDSLHPTTHELQGNAMLRRLADREEVRALGDLSPPHIEQLRRLAQAIAFHQQTSGTGLAGYVGGALPRSEGRLMRGLGPFQGAAGVLAYEGHPILGFLSALTPELTGYLLSKTMITTYLTLGLQMNPASPQYAALARQLMGALAAEGISSRDTPTLQGQTPTTVPGTPPAPAPGQGTP